MMKRKYISPKCELLSVTTATVIAISNYWNWGDGKKDDFEEENQEFQGDYDDVESNEMGVGDFDHFHHRMWREDDEYLTH
ncbi:MAG: hypothetical protein J6I60_05610 [Bacteroidaceae bacterium]|nr:hypothetical protein [Bacteroidaceae bacterium]